MSVAEPQPATSKPARRWFYLTPDRFIIGLLAVEGLLWLLERFQWFPFNEKKGWTVLIAVVSVGEAMLAMLLWFVAGLLFRWRFQFGIRSLLVLTLAVAIPGSWLAAEVQRVRNRNGAAVLIEKRGGWVQWIPAPHAEPSVFGWLQKLQGNDSGYTVNAVRLLAGNTIDDLQGLDQSMSFISARQK